MMQTLKKITLGEFIRSTSLVKIFRKNIVTREMLMTLTFEEWVLERVVFKRVIVSTVLYKR